MSALNALLTGLVDFAGLFPPAGLDMKSAVRAYAAYRQGPYAAVLGSFVVPADRLDEFGAELEALGAVEPGGRSWTLSVLAGDAPDDDISRALRFRAIGRRGPAAQVVSLEARAASAAGVERVTALAPRAVTVAVEIPLSLARDERQPVLSALKSTGRIAKVRTGGVTADAIPSPAQVAAFIWDCARAGVPFKATAGLHHAVRAEQRLTYAPDSARAVMHGFLNVFLAAAVAWKAARSEQTAAAADPPPDVVDLLDERDAASFTIGSASIHWRGLEIRSADVARARTGLARSFGSCSFVEPVAELEALGWLSRQ